MLRIICFVLIATGGLVMVISTVRYHRFIRFSREESYGEPRGGRGLRVVAQLTMVFFIIGFVVGATDVARREVEPIYLFVGFVFFIGSLFIAALVQNQISMAASLRTKTLEVMRTFVNSIEMKDEYTKGHSRHVYQIVRLFYQYLPAKTRAAINEPKLLDAALLHDIGKIGIDDRILNKAGELTEREWKLVRIHPELGTRLLADTTFIEISPWVLYHHERMDGEGYYRLPGDKIPLESRIIAVADTYSALTTNRIYRPRRSHEEAVALMKQVAGAQLDARLVEWFCSIPRLELEVLALSEGVLAGPGEAVGF